MKNDARYILDGLLAEWHKWAKSFAILGSHGTAPMFNGLVSSRQWDSESDVIDGDLHHNQMESVDFHISELEPTHRTAIQIQARNLYTGKSVWSSARLPIDVNERTVILAMARNILTRRLTEAGIM
jgi:hypothetical protein